VTNTAVHELGHVLGLDHCEESELRDARRAGGDHQHRRVERGAGAAVPGELDREAPLRPAGALLARGDVGGDVGGR
jgi:hypothetical protein